jgi:hypothetical protein
VTLLRTWVLAAVLLAVPASAAQGAVRATQVGSFENPVYVTAPPEDPHRLFVVEQEGTLRIIRDGVKLSDPFIDISANVISGGEQGFLNVAFAPDYRTSGKLYLYYTERVAGDTGSNIVVEEVTRSADPDRADPATRRNILRIRHPVNGNHNGGQLMFGPDGLLWVTTGDGGAANDPPNNAQNPQSLLGKVLRIDPRGGSPEVWAIGLRNPFRASFDRATGDLTIADVGQGRAEEVNFSPAAGGLDRGANFGWRCYEGLAPNPVPAVRCDLPNRTDPVLEQLQESSGFCAIIGGYVVRDPALTDLVGRYVYGDNCAPGLRSAVLAKPRATDDRPVGLTINGLSSFGEDSCGHVYATALEGPVYRLDGDAPPAPCPEPAAQADARAPVVRVSRARRQRALRRRGFVVAVTCDETCGFAATGRMRISGSRTRYVLRAVSRQSTTGRRVRVRLRMSAKGTRALRRALARRRRGAATIRVVARDAAGNQSRRRVGVRALR